MTKDEAKKILALYRPGTADRNDPLFNAAAELAKSDAQEGETPQKPDPELSRWFQEHCASYNSIREKLLQIPVPPDLKEKILAGQAGAAKAKVIRFRPMILLQAAAAIVVLVGLTFLLIRLRHPDDNNFGTYRERMARIALQPYGMPLHTNSLQSIQSFLAGHKAPSDYVLPEGIAKAQAIGCAIERWQGAPVSLLCFNTGQTASPADKPDLWLFIANQTSVKEAPVGDTPVVAQTVSLTTASWSRDGKTYVLAVAGDEAFLRKYL